MNVISRINARLTGARLILLAVLFSIPDVLNALVGFDWAQVLPAGYEGYGAKIGAVLMLVRLAMVPVLKSVRDAARDGARQGGRDVGGDPRP
jgi:hypothetical protein